MCKWKDISALLPECFPVDVTLCQTQARAKNLLVGQAMTADEVYAYHDLRHTFATRLNASGADPYTIRDLLGHSSSTTMTGNYTHTSNETRRQAIRR